MTTGPDHEPAPTRGDFRAAHADREHAITILKAAFVQGRLTKDELESRVAQAFTAKTYADLAMLTADIPAAPGLPAAAAVPDTLPATGPAAPAPASTPARTLGRAARRSGVCMLICVILIESAVLTGIAFLTVPAFFAFMAASGFLGYGIIDARQQRRSRRQLPSQPSHDGPGLRDGRPAQPGPDPAPPDLRADHARTDLCADHARTDLPRRPQPRQPGRPASPRRPARSPAHPPAAGFGDPQPTFVPFSRLGVTA